MKIVRLPALAGLLAASLVAASASTAIERFATDPALAGWRAFGDTNLFQWDATNKVLDVTWDSTQTNSYYYLPLGRTYTMADGFCVQFDLQLTDAIALNSGSELAVGLLHFSDATNADFSRANVTSPNLCEFDYFPAYFYDGQPESASVDATLIDANLDYYFAYDNVVLNPGMTYRVLLIHEPGAGTITAQVCTNGQLVSSLPWPYGLPDGDFQLDTLAISSFQDDGYGDSILAHGTVGNLAFASPLPVGWVQIPAAGQVQFASDTHWLYTLEKTTDFQTWTPAAAAVFGNGANLRLQATNPPADRASYRVEAELP